MADTPNGETVTPGDSQTPVQTPATPVVNAADPAEVERLRKEVEQVQLRNRQLENIAEANKKAEDEAKAKQLEEKEELRTLYEQTQARLKEIEDANAATERSRELQTATEDILKEYPDNVKALAQTAGLSLSEDSDAARAVLKEKLDSFKAQVGSQPGVTGNNPANPAANVVNREELVARAYPGAESPMAMASARGDDSVTRKYISDLAAIKRMREIAQNGN